MRKSGQFAHVGRCKKGSLHLYTFSNGQRVELCRKDFIRYHKDIWRINEQRAAFFDDEPIDDDSVTDLTQLTSFDVPGDVDPFDEWYELP